MYSPESRHDGRLKEKKFKLSENENKVVVQVFFQMRSSSKLNLKFLGQEESTNVSLYLRTMLYRVQIKMHSLFLN